MPELPTVPVPQHDLAIHCIPVGGSEPLHYANRKCWCQPLLEDTGPGLAVCVHNAKDGRETRERATGKARKGHHWVNVGELH